jgi:hypothetical protein
MLEYPQQVQYWCFDDRRARKIALLRSCPASVLAQGQPGENVTYGYAQVLRATPCTRPRVRVPETRCDAAARPMPDAGERVAVRRIGGRR